MQKRSQIKRSKSKKGSKIIYILYICAIYTIYIYYIYTIYILCTLYIHYITLITFGLFLFFFFFSSSLSLLLIVILFFIIIQLSLFLLLQGRREKGSRGCTSSPAPPTIFWSKNVFPRKIGKHKIFACDFLQRVCKFLFLMRTLVKTKSNLMCVSL